VLANLVSVVNLSPRAGCRPWQTVGRAQATSNDETSKDVSIRVERHVKRQVESLVLGRFSLGSDLTCTGKGKQMNLLLLELMSITVVPDRRHGP
jgi:hypothetical protein